MKKVRRSGGGLRGLLLLSLLLVAFLPPYAHAASAQSLSLSVQNASMKQIMQQIKRTADYDFVVSDADIASVPRRTIALADATIDQIMTAALAGTGLTYTVDDRTIVILRNTERQQVRTEITGRVTDGNGRPIQGASVQVRGTATGTVSDEQGNYRLTVPAGTVNLVFSYIGMETQDIFVAADRGVVDVTMAETATGAGTVVVTGIFTRPVEEYVGATKTITATELKQFQGRDVATTIANIDPSFRIVQNNVAGSNPNRLPEVQLRGASNLPGLGNEITDEARAALNTPLIIMDGFETSLQRLIDMDENEITSITLLKDGASTALYGKNGANGVVVVTTRQPEAGKLRFYYTGGLDIEAPDLTGYDLLDAWEKFELENKAGLYDHRASQTPSQNLGLDIYRNEVLSQLMEGVDTYWLVKPLRVGLGHSHNIRTEGGSEQFQFALSLQYRNTAGVMKESFRNTFNGGIDLTYRTDKLLFRNSLDIGYNQSQESPYGSFADYAELNPYWEPYDGNGNIVKTFSPYYGYFSESVTSLGHIHSGPFVNPMYNSTLNTFDRGDYININNNFSIEWRPVDDLIFRGALGVTSDVSSRDAFKPAQHTAFINETDPLRKGSYDYSDTRMFNWNAQLSGVYSRKFNDAHNVYADLFMEIEQNKSRSFSVRGEGYPDGVLDLLGWALQYPVDGRPSGFESTSRSIGLLGYFSYDYKGRYAASFSVRESGSSKFGAASRWAADVSGTLAWNLHNEEFMADSTIDRLHLFVTFGTTGSENALNAYDAQRVYAYYSGDVYKGWTGAYMKSMGNENLAWQKTNQFNAGVDMDMYDRALNFQANYYIKRTTNLISDFELAFANGFSSYRYNVGTVDNKGLELGANVWLLRDTDRNIGWSVGSNVAWSENKIVKLSQALKDQAEKLAYTMEALPSTLYYEGHSMRSIYAVRSLGIDPSTGRELYLDRDGNVTYTYNPNDRVWAGIDVPKWNGSAFTSFRWHDITLSMSFGFRWGGQAYNQTIVEKVENADLWLNVDRRVLTSRWAKPGDHAAFHDLNNHVITHQSTRFVQDDNAFFNQNIDLQYVFHDTRWQQSMGLNALTLRAGTSELFYLTTIKRERGIQYPFSRTFTFSAQLSF